MTMTGTAASIGDIALGDTRVERQLRLARASVAAIFFINGAATANWLVRIPAVQAKLGLSKGALGIALLGVAVGALLAMPRAGHLVARYGSRPVTRVGAAIFGATLLLPALAPNAVALVLALVASPGRPWAASWPTRGLGRPRISLRPRSSRVCWPYSSPAECFRRPRTSTRAKPRRPGHAGSS